MDQNQNLPTAITDLNEDSLAICSTFLNPHDIFNLATTCKYLRLHLATPFQHLLPPLASSVASGGARDAYFARLSALLHFRFEDPLVADICTQPDPYGPMLLDRDDIFISRGSAIQMLKIDSIFSTGVSFTTLSDHKARITCMRLFPLGETSLFRSEGQRSGNVLVTSSSDHSIRLWWKGSCQKCFRGHNGPVSTLSDKLLDDGSAKVLASGGEDGTVRLWSLSSSGKRGKSALKATLHGHEKPIKSMSVAGHKTSLLVSIARDSKVRVWDVNAIRSSCCVGLTSLPAAPKVLTAAAYQPSLYSFEMIPAKSLICTGGSGSARLWDVRRNQDTLKLQPVAELDGHRGPVSFLHMDPYKIVTGCPDDVYVNVWDVDSGAQANSLSCWFTENTDSSTTLSSMAVDGCRIVTGCYAGNLGLLRCRDYTNASHHIVRHDEVVSKFWDSQCYSDSDNSDL